MHPLRLEQMTIFDVEPAEVVTIAEELGFPKISLWTTEGMDGGRPVTHENKRSVLERLRSSPVVVDTVEAFLLGSPIQLMEPNVALAAEIGASAVVVVNVSMDDENAAASAFAEFAALAKRHGLLASLEPIYMGQTRTTADGLRLLQKAEASNARLTIDLLHVFRTGTPLTAIAALDPALIGSAQICDGPQSISEKDYVEEGGYSRMVPGSGCFPIEEFLRVIPRNITVGVEVPMRALRERGVSARERTRMVLEATRELQQRLDA